MYEEEACLTARNMGRIGRTLALLSDSRCMCTINSNDLKGPCHWCVGSLMATELSKELRQRLKRRKKEPLTENEARKFAFRATHIENNYAWLI